MWCIAVRCGAVRQACVKPGPAGVLGVSGVGEPLQDDGAGGTRRDRPRQGSRVMPRTIIHVAASYPWLHPCFVLVHISCLKILLATLLTLLLTVLLTILLTILLIILLTCVLWFLIIMFDDPVDYLVDHYVDRPVDHAVDHPVWRSC